MAKQIKHSVAPIYLAAAVWLIFALFFSLSQLWDYVLCGAVSLAVLIAGRAVFPDKTYEIPDPKPKEPEKPKTTGNPELDALGKERDRAVSEMRRLNDAIEDPKISRQIDHLEEVTRKIIDLVVAEPQKLPQIRKFMSYYLPTTLKILNSYDRMGSAGVDGENITATKQKIEAMMDTIVKAYDKQLDALYGEEALDISTDITVMEQMLQQEGLSGSDGKDGITLEL